MKVKVWVEAEAEANVSIADVMSTIAELAHDDRLPMTMDCISAMHRVLVAIPDAQIAEIKEPQRRVIANALREQATRYDKAITP